MTGLQADRSKHGSFLGVDPWTGKAFQAYKRLQVNYRLAPKYNMNFHAKSADAPYAKLFAGSSDDGVVVPQLWIEESGSIKDEDADKYKGGC